MPPILELISPPAPHHVSGAGKTSLLYLIIARAILPSHFAPSVPLNGQGAAVVLFDPLNHFSVVRLVEVMVHTLRLRLQAAGQKINEETVSAIHVLVADSISHVHVFRPQSWSSLLATLRSLPDYLFDGEKHKSMHRSIHSIILDDIDAFVWSIRNSKSSAASTANPLSTASGQLTTALQKLSSTLSCALILTSSSISPTAFRPPLPASWSQGVQVTRFAVRRIDVVKFAPAISAEQADAERRQRWEVVNKGRFECWKIGAGTRESSGFVFRIGDWGVEVEQEDSVEQ